MTKPKKYLKNILISVFFTVLLAGITSAVAYLLDPAIKELFINKSETLIYVIPLLIIIAFLSPPGSTKTLIKFLNFGIFFLSRGNGT